MVKPHVSTKNLLLTLRGQFAAKFEGKYERCVQLTQNDQKFKRMKEAAKQLGFDLEIEK